MPIADGALVAAATLSDRYITSRFLPDKAIDLIDEAASRLRMEIDSPPVEIDELQRAVDRLRDGGDGAREGDRTRPRTSGSPGCAPNSPTGARSWARCDARWEREKPGLNRVGELKERLDELRGQAERAQRDGDFEKASRLLYAEIPAAREGAGRGVRSASQPEDAHGQGGGHRRRHRRGRRRLDRHPGRPAAGGRDREAAAHGGRAGRRA